MAVTAIRRGVSFLVGGLRDRHLTEATVVLGVGLADRSGGHTHLAARRVGLPEAPPVVTVTVVKSLADVRFTPKADIVSLSRYVRFVPMAAFMHRNKAGCHPIR